MARSLQPFVWITRSRGQAQNSAKAFQVAGAKTVVHPLIELTPPAACPAPPDRSAVLILTSQNGVKALAEMTALRHWPIITSGEATAARAREKGFENVRAAGRTSSDIKGLITKDYRPSETKFVHLGSAQARGQIAQTLSDKGYDIIHTPLYGAAPIQIWPDIDLTRLTHIAIYSPMAAKALAGLPRRDLSRLTSLSISAPADKPLAGLGLKARRIAAAPVESALIKRLRPLIARQAKG